jgi:glycosyltransferase involved in cell wall biosynthesis
MSHADAVITPSNEIRQLTIEVGIPEERVFFISNGIDVETFRPDVPCAQIREQWAVAPGEVIVFTARRLVPKNGVAYLVRAAETVLRRFPQARFVIAGDGPERGALEALAGRSKDNGRILFLGNVGREEMPACVAASDIAVLPSLVEATSIAGLEAMAAGKPIVGTRVGGIPEIVKDGDTGILVEPADADALAEGICRLLADPVKRQEMGHSARHRAVDEFSWRAIAMKTVEIYRWASASRFGTLPVFTSGNST